MTAFAEINAIISLTVHLNDLWVSKDGKGTNRWNSDDERAFHSLTNRARVWARQNDTTSDQVFYQRITDIAERAVPKPGLLLLGTDPTADFRAKQLRELHPVLNELCESWATAHISRIEKGRSDLVEGLRRFADGTKRLRNARPSKPGKNLKPRDAYPLGDEYDVQDLLYLYLKMAFGVVREEDPSGTFAGSSSKIDFSVPALGVGIEVKFVREQKDVKEIKAAILLDLADHGKRADIQFIVLFVVEGQTAVAKTDVLEELRQMEGGCRLEVVRCKL